MKSITLVSLTYAAELLENSQICETQETPSLVIHQIKYKHNHYTLILTPTNDEHVLVSS